LFKFPLLSAYSREKVARMFSSLFEPMLSRSWEKVVGFGVFSSYSGGGCSLPLAAAAGSGSPAGSAGFHYSMI